MFTVKSYLSNFFRNYKFVILAFLAWKVGLAILSIILAYFVEFNPTYPYSENLISQYKYFPIYFWGGFDGVHYLNISQNGYNNQFTQAFFPGFPILINFFSFGFIPHLFTAVFLNNLAFLSSLVMVKKLISEFFPKIDYRYVVLLYLSFPTSFFFNAVYNEGIFLFLSLCSFYLFFKQRYFASAIFGGIASSVRLMGIFILPALILIKISSSQYRTFKADKKILWILIIPAGIAGYMLYLQISFGDYLYFLNSQNYFGNSRSSDFISFPQVIYRYIKILTSVNPFSVIYAVSFLEFVITFIFLTIPILFFRKISTGLIFYSLSVVIVPSLTGTFSSMPRYVLVAFPVFFIVASVLRKHYIYLISFLFIILQVFLVTLFAKGVFVG